MQKDPNKSWAHEDPQAQPKTAWRRFLQATVFKKNWTRVDILTSICLYCHILPFGLYCGAMSTTLLDLEQLTHTTTSQIGLMFTVSTVGAFVGAPIGGFILNKVDCRLVLAFSNCAYACTTIALPWSGNFINLMIVSVIHGFFQGILDTAQNVTALLVWGWDASTFLQAFHCLFAIGSFLAPFLTEPFLAPTWTELVPNNSTTNMTGTERNVTEILVIGKSRAQIPFAIIGSITMCSGIAYLIVYFITKKDPNEKVQQYGDKPKRPESDIDKYRNPNQSKKWYMVPMAVMGFMRFASYVGLEITFSSFLMTFTVKALGWNKTQGLTATTYFLGAFAGARIAAIFLVLILSPTTMVVGAMSLMLISYIVLVIFVSFDPVVVTICAVAAGIAHSSFYGCSMSWAYKYLKVSPLVGTVFTSGSWTGVASTPALAGYLIDNTALAFIYMCLSIAILLGLVTYVATITGLKYGYQLSKNAADNIKANLSLIVSKEKATQNVCDI